MDDSSGRKKRRISAPELLPKACDEDEEDEEGGEEGEERNKEEHARKALEEAKKAAHGALVTAQDGVVEMALTAFLINRKVSKELKEMELKTSNFKDFAKVIMEGIGDLEEADRSELTNAVEAIPALVAAYGAAAYGAADS